MINNPLINQSLKISYKDLKEKSIKVHDGYVLLVADYPAPTPTMLVFQDDIDALSAGITGWGPKGARGSHEEHLILINAAEKVRDDYRQLAMYAMITKPGNPVSWVALGFTVKNAASPAVKLEPVQDFRRFISRKVPDGMLMLKWKRPLNSKPGEVRSYIVQVSNTGVQPPLPDGSHGVVNSNIVDIVIKTSSIISPPFVGANYFWITGINAFGLGNSSAVVFYNNPGKIA
jgi:hypothetical protein